MNPIYYLDHCGSTPLGPNVKKELQRLINEDRFANSMASHHSAGELANNIIESARIKISKVFNVANPRQVIFTSGATEANNLVINGFWHRFYDRGCRVLYSAIEHKSALEPCERYNSFEKSCALKLEVDSSGVVNLDQLEAQLKDNPKRLPTLVVVMHTNNEIPVREPVERISELCLKYRAYFHSDAVQGFVREEIDLSNIKIGSLVVSPHKFYGPKGVGVLVLGNNELTPPIVPPVIGGDQEFGFRPGTLNLLAIAGSVIAFEELQKKRGELLRYLKDCDEVFVKEMKNKLGSKFHLTVPMIDSAPGIINFYVENMDAQTLLSKLKKTCINRGASCTGAGGEKYSHVPKALGLPVEIQANVLRASFGWGVKVEEIYLACEEIFISVSS